ncbi:protein FAR1-RELATED SEQUENCE 5-like [Apium graveolens]|uniref:protein FAR1-RELATED SEQUENCE 5-like n=1 Tax=Apium graveolens TaxID=4045 RepID=UPI003D7927FB
MRNEHASTFEWILRTWLEGVGNNPPLTIITDQDQAMTSAIAYHLQDHKWLNGLYELKHKWISAYSRNKYSEFQISTSRSERMNSFFDKYVSSATGLKEFIENAQKALTRQFMREKEEDYVTIILKRPMKLHTTLEYHASCIYTKEMFRRFQDELVESSKYFVEKD